MPDDKNHSRLLFIILNKVECLQDLIVVFVELGLSGATILNSVGMGKILTQDIPIFAGLKSLISGARSENKVIMVLLHEEMIPLVVEAFEDTVGPLDQPGNGMIISVPVDFVRGGTETSPP
jgi:hypothetical protein